MSKRKMSALWSSSSAESGILRKHDYKEKPEELLVFGYACKLFREDEKAKEIDQGKHLIPWMGDSSLKIDRYDGRGALSDLFPYEASKEGYDATRWLGLNDSERKIEQLCDEERYYAMHINEEEDELYKEEELKRTQSSNQFNYNYDSETVEKKLDNSMGPTLPTEEEDEPFIAPPELDIPVNMSLPKTVKQNARIEKTALFISQQGPQMEILLKTKQAANPQFGFLTQDDALYRYYRHLVMAFKTGRYKIKSEEVENENTEKDEEHYLHPSLAAFSSQNNFSVPTVQTTIPYKPTTDCAYSKLINKIRGTYTQPQENPPAASSTTNSEQQQQQISLYNQQYLQFYQQYGYYPQYYQGQGGQSANFEQQYPLPVNTNNAYSQIVSNVTQKAETPIDGQGFNNGEISKAPILYKSTEGDEKTAGSKAPTTQQKIPTPLPSTQPEPQSTQAYQPPKPSAQASLFVLTEYSGSESENEDETTDAVAVVIPPQEQQIIIDKMAIYVAKNGTDFENIVKLKGDPRFIFLENSHIYHPYYKFKLKENGGGEVKKEETEKKATVEAVEKNDVIKESSSHKKEVAKQKHSEEKVERRSKQKEKKIITPVSFSIKKPAKDSDSRTRDKSALPLEDSSEEDVDKDEDEKEETSSSQDNKESNENSTNNIIEIEDPIMELIDLTDEFEEKKDRRAENKLKDKIVLAAREKLAAKNRALQMERKKRALAFINQLKPQNSSQVGEKMNAEEIRIIRPATPEEGEISEIFASIEDVSQTVYHIQKPKSPKSPRIDKDSAKSPAEPEKERNRSRSRSKSRYKFSKHHKKSQKRSHSRTRKRKREKKSHDHKKSKRRHHSRSRSGSRHRKDEKKDHSMVELRRNRKKSPENSSNSNNSDIEITK